MSPVFQKPQHSDSLTDPQKLNRLFKKDKYLQIHCVFFFLYCYVIYLGVIWVVLAKNVYFTYKSLVRSTVKLISCIDQRCHTEKIENITFRFMIYMQIFPGYVTIIINIVFSHVVDLVLTVLFIWNDVYAW